MQFHLNGYDVGDPEVRSPLPGVVDVQGARTPPETADVVVVGCGPAGFTLAAQLAAFPDIKTCIFDRRPTPLERGHADGIACRTMEMFNAFGFAELVLRESYWVNETTFWTTSDDPKEGISRSGRVQDTADGLSEFPHVTINQARVQQFYLDIMRKSASKNEPFYGRRLVTASVAEGGEYPVLAEFEHTREDGSTAREFVKARYLVGCDGARSQVRSELGLSLKGESANQAWGVMDVLLNTDFPDIRMKALINSANGGSVIVIPREGGYLSRIYVEMDKLGTEEQVAARSFTAEDIIGVANRVFHPYVLDVKDVPWWSVYEIAQRMCDRFDNLEPGDEGSRNPRIFIAGDACHTHSPKAGQGMNVSMQDTFNLGWKLAAVLQGRSPASLLKTYSEERWAIAKDLIDFDREWAMILHAASREDAAPEARSQVQDYFVRHGRYTAGTATKYTESLLTGSSEHQHLASGFEVGTRFHSAPVVRLCDAKPMHLGHVIEADGRWRILAFAPDTGLAASIGAIRSLCDYLMSDPASPIVRSTPAGATRDSVIDIRAIFPAHFRDMEITGVSDLLMPTKGVYELRDYEKIFCARGIDGSDIYDERGINRELGCLVVVRPDQYVSHVLPLDATVELSAFFERFLLSQG